MLFNCNPGKKPASLTKEMAVNFATEHIARYSRMIDSGSPNVRVGECMQYLGVWQEVLGVGGDWDRLSNAARNELLDAYEEEYGE